jgi:hypothetical protein
VETSFVQDLLVAAGLDIWLFKGESTMSLKEKLKNWLLKEELNDLKELKEKFEYTQWVYNESCRQLERAQTVMNEARDMHDKSRTLVSDCHKFMNSICDVGTDIGFCSDDHSWAVICIHGKMDYVKFVDMGQKDIQSIANFLKNFEYSNRVTDSPLNKRWIEDMILRM